MGGGIERQGAIRIKRFRRLGGVVAGVDLQLVHRKGVIRDAGLIRVQHELVIRDAVHREDGERGLQQTVLIQRGRLVIKGKAAVGVIALLRRSVLDSEEGIDEPGAGRLLIGVGK